METPQSKRPPRSRSYSERLDRTNGGDRDDRRQPASLGRTSGHRARAAHSGSDEEAGLRRGELSDSKRSKTRRSPGGGDLGSGSRTCCGARPRLITLLAGCTILFGPVGTVLTFLLIPDAPGATVVGESTAAGRAVEQAGHMRVLHLALAGTDVKARFVIDDRSTWETFLAGVMDRLKITRVTRITDGDGDAIMTLSDVMHEDTLVIHATNTTFFAKVSAVKAE